jgi:hypothetical protein
MHFPNLMRRGAVLVVSAGLILGCGDDDDGGDEAEPPTAAQEEAFRATLADRGHDEEFVDCATEGAMDQLSSDEMQTVLETPEGEQDPTDEQAEVFAKILAISEECGVNIFEVTTTTGGSDDTSTDDTSTDDTSTDDTGSDDTAETTATTEAE